MARVQATPRVAVVGTGSWGTTLAVLAARKGNDVMLWARTPAEAETLDRARENVAFVPGLRFPPNLIVTSDLAQALDRADLLLLVVPAQTMRANARLVREALPDRTIVISCAKGLELKTGAPMSRVLADELPPRWHDRIAALSGPNLFREIADGLPTASVVACARHEVALAAQEILNLPTFRIYTSEDVIGVELAGALKNVVAIAAGAVDGFGFGDNTRATLLTRGLAEITRLGTAAGAQPLTYLGLAGIGDLVATCASPRSRNHFVGEQLARGKKIEEIRREMKMVAEGVPTCKAALELAAQFGVEMPIAEQVHAVIFENKDPQQAMLDLIAREPKRELEGLG